MPRNSLSLTSKPSIGCLLRKATREAILNDAVTIRGLGPLNNLKWGLITVPSTIFIRSTPFDGVEK